MITAESPEKLSHAYIICRSTEKARIACAENIAAIAVCGSEGMKPCGECRACRKVKNNIHPDVIHLRRLTDDKGKTKKFFSVDQVRELKQDSVVLPNESDYKVYIIEEAEKMNPEAQNAALKLLEEPPKGVIMILCAENESSLLTTVRSRCTEIRAENEEEKFSDAVGKRTGEYFGAVASKSAFRLAEYCAAMERLASLDIDAYIAAVSTAAGEMLSGERDSMEIPVEQLIRIFSLMQRLREMRVVNISAKTCFGLMMTDTFPDD